MPRSYHSPRREADAAATRGAIIDAAARLFVRDGYAATSLRAIAAEAGVSLPTVQLNGPKSGLLIAAFERSFAGDEGAHSLTERPQIAAIMSEPDFEKALAGYLGFLVGAHQRSAAIRVAMRAAADADPAARAADDELETRRMRDIRLGAEWFSSRGRLEGISLDVATDVFGHLTAPETYLYFTESRGWSDQRYVDWLGERLRRLADYCD